MLWSVQPSLERVRGGVCHRTAKALPEYSAQRSNHRFTFTSKGFTLIELLVVVALLGLVSLAAVLNLDNVEQDTVIQITKTEMIEVRKALRQFRQDTGSYPIQTHPADFSQLLSNALPAGLTAWSPDTGRGWRGPYLSHDGNGLVSVGDNLLDDGNGSILMGAPVEVAGIADEFMYPPDSSDLLAWRDCTDAGNSACDYKGKWGRPLMLFYDANNRPRLVSMGPDGRYGGVNVADACAPGQDSDDLVLCL